MAITEFWKSSKLRLAPIRARNSRQQQWDDESFELGALSSPSSQFEKDTSYASNVSLIRTTSNAHRLQKSKSWLPSRVQRYQRSRGWLSGWRFGVINCAVWASIVFFINFVVTVWASTAHKRSGGNVLFEGDCDRVDNLNMWVHLLINLFSTVLLSSSNYCMQCLSAPTRRDVDRAHAKRVWLDIGVPSIHNLKRISKKRFLLWALLGLSSLPLHLFYNSAVYSSLAVNNYWAISVSESFISDQECYNCDNITVTVPQEFGDPQPVHLTDPTRMMWDKAHRNELEKLSNADCIRAYANMLQSKRRNVLLVTSDVKAPGYNASTIGGSRVHGADRMEASKASSSVIASNVYVWICRNFSWYRPVNPWNGQEKCTTHVGEILVAPENWVVQNPVDYCLSELAEPHCKLQFVPAIAILVTCLNLFKACLIFYVAFYTTDEPLLTMGDAVVSFLEVTDLTTRDMCLLTMQEVKKSKHHFLIGSKQWTDKRRRWKEVTSLRRRITTILMAIIAVMIIIGLFVLGVNSMPKEVSRSLPSLARLGYGSIDPRTIIHFDNSLSLASNVLIANIAQPLLSFLYFSYNGLFTCMLLGYEWSTYAHNKKGLRVSRAAAGSQRSTYFLQLPYRFALPLMALSGILHWLVSQSIFLVSLDVYDWNGGQGDLLGWKSCGYSPIAIFTVIILVTLMIFAIIGFGFVPFKRGTNLVGSCSVAISAACHLRPGEPDGHTAAMSRLQWGDVGFDEDGVGHCAFSTKEVVFPKDGALYGGLSRRRIVPESSG